MIIFGTAGHINHGKTALVEALTGKNCDALADEQKRGITIELGFAHFKLKSGETLALIDMPGHAKLLRTMAAGAAGVQGVLMVISAEAGVMPQTREHINVCELLGITKGIVVLTHLDKVEDPEFATEFIKEELEDTFLRDAPVIGTVPPQGIGIKDTANAINELTKTIQTQRQQPFTALPIDRIFSKEGFGTIITGSLVAGEIKVDEEIVALPSGKSSRVRHIQTQNKSVKTVRAPARVALNLPDFSKKQLDKGNLLTGRDELICASLFDARLKWLPHNLKNMSRKRGLTLFLQGTQALAHVQALTPIQPGEEGIVRVRADRELPLMPGCHFLLRGPLNPQWGGIVAGGQILDCKPPQRRKRAVRQALFEDPANAFNTLLKEAGTLGLGPSEVLSRLGIERNDKNHFFHADVIRSKEAAVLSSLEKFHAEFPNEPGIASSRLRKTRLDDTVISELLTQKKIGQIKDAIHLASFTPPDEEGLKSEAASLLDYLTRAKFTPEAAKELYTNGPQGDYPLNKTLQYLVETNAIVKVGDFFVAKKHLDRLAKMAATALTHGDVLAVQWLKDRTGASRKHAIPLFEYLDRIGVTARDGNTRKAGAKINEWL